MIDWERVAQLRDEVGPEDFAEVVELFLEEVEEVIERLAKAPDPANLRDDMHFLKGSALNLGFAVFGEMCQEGEKRAAAGRAGEIDLAPLLACYEESRRVFLEAPESRAVA